MMETNFNYESIKEHAKALGILIHEELLKDFDYRANLIRLTQEQMEFVFKAHLDQLKLNFTPKNYSFLQRLKIALFFLRG